MRTAPRQPTFATRSITEAVQALRSWTGRQVLVATAAALVFGLVLGLATVLIPNTFFTREIPPVWWNYPVWVLTSVLSGMLVATYVRGRVDTAGAAAPTSRVRVEDGSDAAEQRTSRLGVAGGLLAWFAVGCPVCNKLALLALGYSGAITWFAPIQPYLALGALLLTGIALLARLRGQLACPVPTPRMEAAR
ncbi:hypothetical protein AB0333_16560 [Citricoccus sp. NPDC079358]|uniref:hypothetical protein n=1 Tax=Citricoccus sp. NPDC079358 TaxID=3154653 RepID=UPI00344D5DF2